MFSPFTSVDEISVSWLTVRQWQSKTGTNLLSLQSTAVPVLPALQEEHFKKWEKCYVTLTQAPSWWHIWSSYARAQSPDVCKQLALRDAPSWVQYYIVLCSTVILPAGSRESIFNDCEIDTAGVLGPRYSN